VHTINPKQERAAYFMAVGVYSQQAIARMVGVDSTTITAWKRDEVFCATIEGYRQQINEPLNSAIREVKKLALSRLHQRLWAGDDPDETRLIDIALKIADAPAIDKSSHDKIKDMIDGIKPRNG